MKIKTKIYSFFLIVIIVFSGALLFHLSETRNVMIDEVGKNGITFARDISDRLDQGVHTSMINLQIIGTQTTVQDFVIKSNQDYAKIVAITELYDASQKSQVKCEK